MSGIDQSVFIIYLLGGTCARSNVIFCSLPVGAIVGGGGGGGGGGGLILDGNIPQIICYSIT